MKYVIIGNSTAAIGGMEGIRSQDTNSEIVVLSNEAYHTYSRPLISYLLQGKTDLERMKYRHDNFYKEMNCELKLETYVTEIHPDKKEIVTQTGEVIGYDKLLVATGSRPFVPTIEGLEKVKDPFTFMTLDSAKALSEKINEKSKVLIVGAGLIGLKCAEAISKKVASLTVCDIAPHVLSSIVDMECGERLKKHLENYNIQFKLGTGVQKLDAHTAYFQDGTTVEFDILVLAVGVRPNVELVQQAGGRVNRGIILDEYCQTSLENIYAAGDCTESVDLTDGNQKILAILPNAYRQGECAGINMALGKQKFDKAIPMNAIGFFGLHLISAGSYEGEEIITQDENNYKKLIVKDDLLKGFMMLGDVEGAGIYTSIIREQIPLSSLNFELLKERPGLIAFSRNYRDDKLGGRKNEH